MQALEHFQPDLILIDGRFRVACCLATLLFAKPGARIPLEVIRDGKSTTIYAVVGTRPPEEQLAGSNFDPEDEQATPDDPKGAADTTIQTTLGLAVQTLTPDIARAVGVGDQSAALLFGQSQGDSAKGPLITVDALQPAPGGDAEAYLVVLPTP